MPINHQNNCLKNRNMQQNFKTWNKIIGKKENSLKYAI